MRETTYKAPKIKRDWPNAVLIDKKPTNQSCF